MSKNKILPHLFWAYFLMLSCSSQSDTIQETADSIYYGSNLFSFDGYLGRNNAAVAVKDRKVIFIGSRASAEKLRGTNTELYDLGQKAFFGDLLTNTTSSSSQSGSRSANDYSSLKSFPKLEEEYNP